MLAVNLLGRTERVAAEAAVRVPLCACGCGKVSRWNHNHGHWMTCLLGSRRGFVQSYASPFVEIAAPFEVMVGDAHFLVETKGHPKAIERWVSLTREYVQRALDDGRLKMPVIVVSIRPRTYLVETLNDLVSASYTNTLTQRKD
jgi:hypothetical protein